jgi:hypothetical protein
LLVLTSASVWQVIDLSFAAVNESAEGNNKEDGKQGGNALEHFKCESFLRGSVLLVVGRLRNDLKMTRSYHFPWTWAACV